MSDWKLHNKPVFKNEVIGEHNGSNAAQYRLKQTGEDGAVELQLLNPIIEPGTPLNAETLNAVIKWIEWYINANDGVGVPVEVPHLALSECPFCLSRQIIIRKYITGHYDVSCDMCFCGTDTYQTPDYAAKAWNRRGKRVDD